MKKYIFIVFLLPHLIWAQQTADQYFNKGYDHALEGKFNEAVAQYSKALELNPNYANAYYNRGWVYYQLTNYTDCVRDMSKVIAYDDTFQPAYMMRGTAYYSLQFYQKAFADYQKAVELNPKDKISLNNMGLIMEQENKNEEALKYYNLALEIDPNYKSAKNNRDAIQKIAAKSSQKTEQSTNNAHALLVKADAELEKRDYQNAIALLDEAIQNNRNFRDAYEKRGWAKSRLGEYEQAIIDFNRALELGANKTIYNKSGWAKYKLGWYEEAIADFDQALLIDPNYSEAKDNRKWVLKKMSDQQHFDQTPPTIVIISPNVEESRGLGITRMDESATIVGRATDKHGIEQVLVNGNQAHLKSTGDFDIQIKLANGKNTIHVVAFDFNGNKAENQFYIERKAAVQQKEKPFMGKQYALLIATDQYESWTSLNNPVYDAKAIKEELETSYNFEVQLLENAKKRDILLALRQYAQKQYAPNDQLFIMFAGHGHFDEVFEEGYVVTTDSSKDDEGFGSYISHSQLRTYINNIKIKHIFLTMDVCFGGTFDPVIAHRGMDGDNSEISRIEYINRKMRFKTRRYLTSGGKEYVSDGRAGKHSPFARKFLEALRSYGGKDGILTTQEIISYVETLSPEPRFGEFGDNEPGSDFIFLSK